MVARPEDPAICPNHTCSTWCASVCDGALGHKEQLKDILG